MLNAALQGIILAAGDGVGVKGSAPRPLWAACGVPIVELAARAMKGAGVEHPVIVVDQNDGSQIREALGTSYQYAWTENAGGSARVAQAAESQMRDYRGPVLVVPAEAALITHECLQAILQVHRDARPAVTLATLRMQDPTGHPRVVRDPHGKVARVIQERDANPRVRDVKEVATGVFCFQAEILFSIVPKLVATSGDVAISLSDLVEQVYDAAGSIETRICDDPQTFQMARDLWELSKANTILRKRILRQHCLNGVVVVDPETTFAGFEVEIAPGARIEPMTTLQGATKIGENCHVGPQALVINSVLEEGSSVFMSQVNGATIKKGARIGPFSNLRPGAIIGENAKVGNFVEVKNASLGDNASVSHLAYIGDGSVGNESNIGAGVIFCNYDGFNKSRTEVGERAFVGSNSTLIAPVTIGDGAVVAAGSTITHDVPADAGAFARSRQETKQGWAVNWRKRKQPGSSS